MELRSITVETLAAFAQALRAEERCTETIKQFDFRRLLPS